MGKVRRNKGGRDVILRKLAALGLIGIVGTANAAEVIDSTFKVEYTRDGQTYSKDDTVVPYLPDSSCYTWYVKFDPGTKDEVVLVETFRLPEPLAAWKDFKNDPAAATQIEADAQGAITTVTQAPDADGFVSNGWCVAAGDPLGEHTISVAYEGKEIAHWTFTVVAEADYQFEPVEPPADPSPPAPPPQPSPTARDVSQSW